MLSFNEVPTKPQRSLMSAHGKYGGVIKLSTTSEG